MCRTECKECGRILREVKSPTNCIHYTRCYNCYDDDDNEEKNRFVSSCVKGWECNYPKHTIHGKIHSDTYGELPGWDDSEECGLYCSLCNRRLEDAEMYWFYILDSDKIYCEKCKVNI